MLTSYSGALFKDTNGALTSFFVNKISDGKIVYDYEIRYGANHHCKIFEIRLLDLMGSISMEVQYLNDTETFYIKDSELENTIDEIISSDRMGRFLGYLISINS